MSNKGLSSLYKGRSQSTPQTQKARADQVKNAAGGYVFKTDDWTRLDRFLLIGTEGGTFYAGAHELALKNADHAAELIRRDSVRVVQRVIEISQDARAYKNDYAIFVLAMVVGWGSVEAKRLAMGNLSKVCRTASHLLQFISYSNQFRGWGRVMVNGISHWYLEKSPKDLIFQVTKYANREGWTHRDVLRQSHTRSEKSSLHNSIFAYLAGKAKEEDMEALVKVSSIMKGLQLLASIEITPTQAINDYDLQREHLPTEALQDNDVVLALAMKSPLTATLRSLGPWTARGLITEKSELTKRICEILTNQEALIKARIHPMAIMVAANTYRAGRGEKGNSTWVPSHRILLALDEAFYLTFKSVVPTNKRILLGVDFSGSMEAKYVQGVPNLDARTAALAMSLIQVNTEPNHELIAFSSVGYGRTHIRERSTGYWNLDIHPGQALDQVMKYCSTQPGGGTDGSRPIQYAIDNNKVYDAIVIYTDNETWAGERHVYQAMESYRRQFNPNCKLIVVGLTATGTTMATPDDNLTLDVVGFDASIAQVINNFIS